MSKVLLVTDGATGDSNPGPITLGGVLLTAEGVVISSFCKSLGEHATNNVAEYKALIHGLEMSLDLGYKDVHCFVDSKLVANQLASDERNENGGVKTKRWKCNDSKLQPLQKHAMSLLKYSVEEHKISWHRRETVLAAAADDCSKGKTYNPGHQFNVEDVPSI